MKKQLLFKTLLVVAMTMGSFSLAQAGVNTDGSSRKQYVWNLGCEAKASVGGTGTTDYYLKADESSYGDYSAAYGTSGNYNILKATIYGGRCIFANNDADSDKGGGANMANGEGKLQFYAPIAGVVTLVGCYINRPKIYNTTKGTNAQGNSYLEVSEGDVIEIYSNQDSNSAHGIEKVVLTQEYYNESITAPSIDVTDATMTITAGVASWIAGGVSREANKGAKGHLDATNITINPDVTTYYTTSTSASCDDPTYGNTEYSTPVFLAKGTVIVKAITYSESRTASGVTSQEVNLVNIGDFYLGNDGCYYTYSDLASKTTPYYRTTYDFTSYRYYTNNNNGKSGAPSGFSDGNANIKYESTILNTNSNSTSPTGLTFTNNSGGDAYLQYYANMGMQAGTGALTLSVTNATANTVSYLYYKQGASSPTNTVAATSEESTPITISGTASVELPVKTTSYKLYTRLEVFTKDVPATLGTNGYATFASPYPLDLTTANLPEGLKAYKAAVSGTTVTFTLLNQTVPANTGILLQGEASGLYDIPVVASGTEVTENAFLVNTGGTTFAGDEDYYYFGLKKNTLTFGTFTPGILAIPANKAYLKVAKSNFGGGAARELSFSFGDDETTRVETMNHALGSAASLGEEPITVNQYYDLQGRRVAQPTRGLYIVNGKKVVVK